MISLRNYQSEAIKAMVDDYLMPGNSVVVLPQGSGKSVVIAELAKRINGNILILAPSIELVEQNTEKLVAVGIPREDIGEYLGSKNKHEVGKKYTIGIINSVYKTSDEFGYVDCAIIDECDLVNEEEIGMYRDFFDNHRSIKCFGLTATPYRGVIEKTRISYDETLTETRLTVLSREGNFWKEIIYCKNVSDLTPEYLVPIEYHQRPFIYDHELKLNSNGGEYSDMSINSSFMQKGKIDQIVKTIQDAEATYRSLIVFCSSVGICQMLSDLVPKSRYITGDTKITPKKERSEIIKDFKSGKIKTVFSVDVLSVGFNYDELEAIIFLRPTKSVRKYQQMVGRVTRKATIWTGDIFNPYFDKQKGVLIDLTNTSRNMGEIAKMEVKKIDGQWDLLKNGEPQHGTIISAMIRNNKTGAIRRG
jgi:DNA repair protein RadD